MGAVAQERQQEAQQGRAYRQGDEHKLGGLRRLEHLALRKWPHHRLEVLLKVVPPQKVRQAQQSTHGGERGQNTQRNLENRAALVGVSNAPVGSGKHQ